MKYTIDNIRDAIYGLDEVFEIEGGEKVPAINLDNGATTPPFKDVIEDIKEKLLCYGSVGRGKGQKSQITSDIYNKGYETVKKFVGADSDEYTVFYVNSTTDGMNKLASALITSPNDIVISSRMEHHANDLPWRERAKAYYVDVDENGRLNIGEYFALLKKFGRKVKYVTITAASNVTGYVNDVHAIARVAHSFGAKIIVDGAQIVAHRKFNMISKDPDENIDFFVFSAHKMYSPFGGGAVVGLKDILTKEEEINDDNEYEHWINNNSIVRHIPHFYGGGMVDSVLDDDVIYTGKHDVFEAGSPNYPGVVGMLKAMEILTEVGFDAIEAHEQKLLKIAIEGLSKISGVTLYGDSTRYDDRVGTVAFNIKLIHNSIVADLLAKKRAIAVRDRAFCAHPYVRRLTDMIQLSATDNACGRDAPEGMVRASFGIYNNEQDVKALIDTVKLISESAANLDSAALERNISAVDSNMPNDRG